jgi:hypothetical protein
MKNQTRDEFMLSDHHAGNRAISLFTTGILFAFIAGCGQSESAAPKKDLSDKEKQQIKELNEQRASEWASTKRK